MEFRIPKPDRAARLVLVTAVALLSLAGPARATFPGANGRIAFVRGSDTWTMKADGSDQQQVPNNTPAGIQPCSGAPFETQPVWSPDGAKLAVVARGTAACSKYIYTVNPDGTGLTPLVPPNNTPDSEPAWSPDGAKIAFIEQAQSYMVMNADGTNRVQLPTDPGYPVGSGRQLDWSPDGDLIADSHGCQSPSTRYGAYIGVMQPIPGGTRTPLTNPTLCPSSPTTLPNTDVLPSWSPDAQRILFLRSGTLMSIKRDGSDLQTIRSGTLPDGGSLGQPVWSPDGTKIAFVWSTVDSSNVFHADIGVMNADGSSPTRLATDGMEPSWQAVPQSYIRPRGATPFLTYLVPAYDACSAPNDTHGAPLAFGSCSPPTQTSSRLTIGTPDANALAAGTIGSVRYSAVVGNPSTPTNEADLKIGVSVTGVLNKSDLTPYDGELSADAGLRITDRSNSPSPGGPGPGTVEDTSFPVTVPCTAGTCVVSTSANALMPGAVLEGRRAIWQLGQVKVYDGGADGVASTAGDDTLFMVEGVFVP